MLERYEKMKKKRIIALLLSVCMLFTACSGNPNTSDPENSRPLIEIDRGGEVKINISGVDGRSFIPAVSGLTCVATVFGYYGISVKPDALRFYAPIVEGTTYIDGKPSPYKKIVGNPMGLIAFYYAAPIIEAVENYFKDYPKKTQGRVVKNISGATVEEIKGYIDREIPVIIWGTVTGNAAIPIDDYSWITDEGDRFTGKMSPRCYTVIGYNNSEILVLSDNGKQLNVMNDTFIEMYESYESQAIVIE